MRYIDINRKWSITVSPPFLAWIINKRAYTRSYRRTAISPRKFVDPIDVFLNAANVRSSMELLQIPLINVLSLTLRNKSESQANATIKREKRKNHPHRPWHIRVLTSKPRNSRHTRNDVISGREYRRSRSARRHTAAATSVPCTWLFGLTLNKNLIGRDSQSEFRMLNRVSCRNTPTTGSRWETEKQFMHGQTPHH